MKKKSISLIIGLMSIALLGVMAMQYYFIRESYQLKSQLFDQTVNEALNKVVQKHEKQDALLFKKEIAEKKLKAFKESKKIPKKKDYTFSRNYLANKLKIRKQKIDRDFKIRDSLLKVRYPRALPISSDFYETYMKDPADRERVIVNVQFQQFIDEFGRVFRDEVRDFWFEGEERPIKKGSLDTLYYLVQDQNAKLIVIPLPRINAKLSQSLKNEPAQQVKKVNFYLDSLQSLKQKTALFEELANEYEQAKKPLKERINLNAIRFIDTLLREELFNLGINLPYNAAIKFANSDSVIFTQIADNSENFRRYNTYHTSLFPSEVVRKTATLAVTFPGKNSFMFQNMGAILSSSFALLLVVIGCFAYTVFIIFRQKKIAEMKTDFINNMTHEFKTPVATIMIASEALKDPEIAEDRKRVDRLAGIIYDENIRLGNHIERVLNIARIEKGDLKLDLKPVDMHHIISAVAESMSLQLQKKNANLTLSLNALESIITGDEDHLSNVIFNLIDNASKYSKDIPQIEISTYNNGKELIVKVSDKGIGMSKDQLSKIFGQFYRISTGNIHDVKGFGLGLSYVNNIVKRLHGFVRVKSEKDKGSEFDIIFPVS